MRTKGAAALAGILLLGGCGNAVGDVHSSGLTGLERTADGHLVAVAYVCRGTVDELSVVRDRVGEAGNQPNQEVATFRSSAPLKGLVRLDLDAPGSGWSPSTPVRLDPQQGYLFTAQGSGNDGGETSTAWLASGKADTVKGGRIYTTDDEDQPTLTPHTEQAFVKAARLACSA